MLGDTLFNTKPLQKATSYIGGIDNVANSVNAAKKWLLGSEGQERPPLRKLPFTDVYDGVQRKVNWFTDKTWLAAIDTKASYQTDSVEGNGHSILRIQPNYALYSRNRTDLKPIKGVINYDVSTSVESQWQELGIPFPFLDAIANGISTISKWGNSGNIGEVYRSKKTWIKSGYLQLEPKFRVIDWDGDGLPIRAAIMAQRYALPQQRPSDFRNDIKTLENRVRTEGIQSVAEEIIGTLKQEFSANFPEASENLENLSGDAAATAQKFLGFLNSKLSNYFDMQSIAAIIKQVENSSIGSQFKDSWRDIMTNLTEEAHDFITLYDSPPPCKLQIGQFFYHPDMIVENVNCIYSDERTKYGPVYVDIVMKLSSRKIMQGYDDEQTQGATYTGLVEPGDSRIIRYMNSDQNYNPRPNSDLSVMPRTIPGYRDMGVSPGNHGSQPVNPSPVRYGNSGSFSAQ